MSTDRARILDLHHRLLRVVREEPMVIRDGDLNTLEEVGRLKVALLAEIAGPGTRESLEPTDREELRSLLQQILSVNEINAARIEELRDKTADEMADLFSERRAERAYLGGSLHRR